MLRIVVGFIACIFVNCCVFATGDYSPEDAADDLNRATEGIQQQRFVPTPITPSSSDDVFCKLGKLRRIKSKLEKWVSDNAPRDEQDIRKERLFVCIRTAIELLEIALKQGHSEDG
jgi:hypothetical protein